MHSNNNIILPIFLPFAGCGNRCLFCDQEAVTSISHEDPVTSAKRQLDALYPARPTWHELAFYGGSFTCLDTKTRHALYDLRGGTFIDHIRLSTRPDCISEDIADEMAEASVSVVELGVQSLSDRVLAANGRPYDRARAIEAANLLNGRFQLAVQIMTGLYDDTVNDLLGTIDDVIALAPPLARIYPTVVFKDTGLAKLVESGRYRPRTLAESLVETAACWCAFTARGITVIRTGLPAGIPDSTVLAGPTHQAYGDLVKTLVLMAGFERGVAIPVGEAYRGELSGYRSIVRKRYGERFDIVDDPVRLDWQALCNSLWSSFHESREWFTEGTIHRLAEELVGQAND